MALARVKTWNPGDTLTAADLNAEFNNILNNPITLVSPTTGAINFQSSVAHINLTPSALTASSAASTGAILIGSTAASGTGSWSTGMNWITSSRTLQVQRIVGQGVGTALTTNHVTLSTQWGSTGVISSIVGTDMAYTMVLVAGSTTQLNPTFTTTYADGLYTNVPIPLCLQQVATTVLINMSLLTIMASGHAFQANFLPTTGATYRFSVLTLG